MNAFLHYHSLICKYSINEISQNASSGDILCYVFNHFGPGQFTISHRSKQLDTYNAQDIDGFAELFAIDAEIFMEVGDTEPVMQGRDEIRERYEKMFRENPQNKSTLKGRIVQGDYVIDHEWITRREDPFSIVAIYEVQAGKIARAWFLR